MKLVGFLGSVAMVAEVASCYSMEDAGDADAAHAVCVLRAALSRLDWYKNGNPRTLR